MSVLRVEMVTGETLTIRAGGKDVIGMFGDALSAKTGVVVESGSGRNLWINPAHVAYIEEKPNV